MAKKSKSSKGLRNNPVFSLGQFSMYMVIFAVVGAFTLWVSFAAPTNADKLTTRVNGETVLYPSSPVCSSVSSCTRAYPNATVKIETYDTGAASQVVGTVTSNNAGKFGVNLKAGNYAFVPVSSQPAVQQPVYLTVSSSTHSAQNVTVVFDSGIR